MDKSDTFSYLEIFSYWELLIKNKLGFRKNKNLFKILFLYVLMMLITEYKVQF